MRRYAFSALLSGLLGCAGWGQESSDAIAPLAIVDSTTLRFTTLEASGEARYADVMVNKAQLLGRGRVLTSDPHERFLAIHDPSMRLLVKRDQSGGGPGEFRHVAWIGRCADRIQVWDQMNRRHTTLNEDLVVLSELNLSGRGTPAGPLLSFACDDAGRFAFVSLDPEGTRTDVDSAGYTSAALLYVLGKDGSLRAIDAPLKGSSVVKLGGGAGPAPLGGVPVLAFAGGNLLSGQTRSTQFDLYDSTGARVRSFSVPLEARPTDSTHYNAAVDEIVGQIRGSAGPIVRSALERLRPPLTLPYYSRAFGTSSGRLWLVTTHPGDSTVQILRVGQFGTVEAQLMIDDSIDLLDISGDKILGKKTLADGTVEFKLFRFR